MSWIDDANEVSRGLIDNRMLLSDALLASIRIFGARIPEIVTMWMNREVVGYDFDDLTYFSNHNFDREIADRVVFGTWLQHGEGEQQLVGNGPVGADSFTQLGIQSIEGFFSESFNIDILRGGSEQKISETYLQSGFYNRAFYISDERFPGYLYQFSGLELTKVYQRVRRSVLEINRISILSLTGKGLLIP